MMIATEVLQTLERLCFEAGFPLFGVVPAMEAPRYELFVRWLDAGFDGTMTYLRKRQDAYKHPDAVLEGCQSVVMLGMPYPSHPDTIGRKSNGAELHQTATSEARLGHYSTGPVDYHEVIRNKLNSIIQTMSSHCPNSRWRGVVDTAPLLERDFAELAGLGWIGKNTLVLNRQWGSYFFLAALLTDVSIPTTNKTTTDHCGTCTACLDACPTQAFAEPHVLNASRCISYLTIEHRGSIDPELMEKMNNWIFGCDECQIVCPWNRKRNEETAEEFFPSDLDQKKSLEHWLTLSEQDFRRLYRHTPYFRTKLVGMQRNALIAAGNTNRKDLLPLIEAHCRSEDAVIAETALWAFNRIRDRKRESNGGDSR